MASIQSFVLSADLLTAWLGDLAGDAPPYCYLELSYCLVFQRWDPGILKEHDLPTHLQAGRLFGPNGELNLRRRWDDNFRCLWIAEGQASSLPKADLEQSLTEVQLVSEDTTALLWGSRRQLQQGTRYYDAQVGWHSYPPMQCGSLPERMGIVVRAYLPTEGGEPVAQRWVDVVPFGAEDSDRQEVGP